MAVPAKTQEIAISEAIKQEDLKLLDRAIKDKANEDQIVTQLIEKSSIKLPQGSKPPVMYVDDREGNENNEVGIRLTAALRKCEIETVREEWNALQQTKRQALQQVSETLTYERLAGVVKNMGKDYVLHKRPVDEDVVGIIKNESGKIKHTFYSDGKQEVECPSTATDEDVVRELLKAYQATQPKEIKSITLSPIYIDGSPTALPSEKIAEIAKEIFSEGVSFSFTAVKPPQNTAGTKVAGNAIEGGDATTVKNDASVAGSDSSEKSQSQTDIEVAGNATKGGVAAIDTRRSPPDHQKVQSLNKVAKRVIKEENATTNRLFTTQPTIRWQAAAELLRTKERVQADELFRSSPADKSAQGRVARRKLAKKMQTAALTFVDNPHNIGLLTNQIRQSNYLSNVNSLRNEFSKALTGQEMSDVEESFKLLFSSCDLDDAIKESIMNRLQDCIDKIQSPETKEALLNSITQFKSDMGDGGAAKTIKANVQGLKKERFQSDSVTSREYVTTDELHLFARLLGVKIKCHCSEGRSTEKAAVEYGQHDAKVTLEIEHQGIHYECAGRIGRELGRNNTAGDGICGITSMMQSLYYTTKDDPELQESLSKFGKEMLGSVRKAIKKMKPGQDCEVRRESRFSL